MMESYILILALLWILNIVGMAAALASDNIGMRVVLKIMMFVNVMFLVLIIGGVLIRGTN